ncbi:MAG: hypothetical protein IPL75_12895 [Acidobacteria bacterium]|nr:hypothetical protein [Acidobacteriota bacterium]
MEAVRAALLAVSDNISPRMARISRRLADLLAPNAAARLLVSRRAWGPVVDIASQTECVSR